MTTQAQIGPGDIDVWVIDWTSWLTQKGVEEATTVTIASSTWTASTPLTVAALPAPSIFDSSRQTKCWWDATDCDENTVVSLTNSIVTSEGHERSMTIAMYVVRR
jgi:hypothetical protein